MGTYKDQRLKKKQTTKTYVYMYFAVAGLTDGTLDL